MRFPALPCLALAGAVAIVAACSSDFDDDAAAPTTVPEAGSDALVGTSSSSGSSGVDSDAGDAGVDAADARAPLGEACGNDNRFCASQLCVDGVCCDQACTGACMACNNAGSIGTCTNIPRLQEDPKFVNDAGTTVNCTRMVAGSKCDGAGKCLRLSKVACASDDMCLSNTCSGSDGAKTCLGATGDLCDGNAECLSGVCSVGLCK